MSTTDTALQAFTVTSTVTARTWHAENAEQAAKQHRKAFPHEPIQSVAAHWDLDSLEATARAATDGPWRWDDHRIPTLYATVGEPEYYLYETEVIEADHDGGCGCRRECTLEMPIGPADRAHIAAMNPQTTLALITEIRALRAQLEDQGTDT